VDTVELDPRKPFSAARARNEGFARLTSRHPDLQYVQFVDGDCELAPGWLEAGSVFLAEHARVATVCGRLRERDPAASVYNALCDIEWDVPPGESQACGGNLLVRRDAFHSVGGFRDDLLAGEEPELARRFAEQGWRNWRIAADMAVHDADMHRFSQWWRRAVRNGYGFAQGFDLTGGDAGRLWARELRSTWLWAAAVPAAILLTYGAFGAPALALIAVYPLQVARLALRGTRSVRVNWWHAGLLVLCKFAHLAGNLAYLRDRGGRMRVSQA
jgi:hypothetical protein